MQSLNIKVGSQVSYASSERTDSMDFLEGASWDSFQRISGYSAAMFKHGVNG